MLCEQCGLRPATVHITRVVNGEMENVHLCPTCAKERGEFQFIIPDAGLMLHNLVAGMAAGQPPKAEADTDLICPVCQTPFAYFQETARLGCPDCYRSFAEALAPILRRLHGAERHVGKVPAGNPELKRQHELEALRRSLKEAIASEQYERAAELRDRIRALEAEGGGAP
jgi:protein arginine kinase activator